MAAAVMGNAAIAARGQEKHLVLERICAERPAMTKHDFSLYPDDFAGNGVSTNRGGLGFNTQRNTPASYGLLPSQWEALRPTAECPLS